MGREAILEKILTDACKHVAAAIAPLSFDEADLLEARAKIHDITTITTEDGYITLYRLGKDNTKILYVVTGNKELIYAPGEKVFHYYVESAPDDPDACERCFLISTSSIKPPLLYSIKNSLDFGDWGANLGGPGRPLQSTQTLDMAAATYA